LVSPVSVLFFLSTAFVVRFLNIIKSTIQPIKSLFSIAVSIQTERNLSFN